jgi:hypothetical protein
MKLTPNEQRRVDVLANTLTGWDRKEHRSRKLFNIALIFFWLGFVAGWVIR